MMFKLGDKVRLNSAYAYYVNKQCLTDAVGYISAISSGDGRCAGKYEVEWEGVWSGMKDDWRENELVLIEDTFKPNQVVNVLDDAFNKKLGYTGGFGEALPQGVVVGYTPQNILPERWEVEFSTAFGKKCYTAFAGDIQAVPDHEVLPDRWGLNKPMVECGEHNHKLWTVDENGCGEFKKKSEEVAMKNNGSKSVRKCRLDNLICFGIMMMSLVALLAVSFGLTYLITASAASFVFMSSQFDLTQWDTIARVMFLPLWAVAGAVVAAIVFMD